MTCAGGSLQLSEASVLTLLAGGDLSPREKLALCQEFKSQDSFKFKNLLTGKEQASNPKVSWHLLSTASTQLIVPPIMPFRQMPGPRPNPPPSTNPGQKSDDTEAVAQETIRSRQWMLCWHLQQSRGLHPAMILPIPSQHVYNTIPSETSMGRCDHCSL